MLLLRDLDRIQVNCIAISSTHLDLAYDTCLFPIKIPKYLVAISYWKACYDRKHLRIPDATLIQTRQKYPEIVVHSYTEREDERKSSEKRGCSISIQNHVHSKRSNCSSL